MAWQSIKEGRKNLVWQLLVSLFVIIFSSPAEMNILRIFLIDFNLFPFVSLFLIEMFLLLGYRDRVISSNVIWFYWFSSRSRLIWRLSEKQIFGYFLRKQFLFRRTGENKSLMFKQDVESSCFWRLIKRLIKVSRCFRVDHLVQRSSKPLRLFLTRREATEWN